MSADLLRQAAALMRERAEAATAGPWVAQDTLVVSDPGPLAKYVADCFDEPEASEADATHIASWHPAVALAVADLLAVVEDMDEQYVPCDDPCEYAPCKVQRATAALARAYLGTP